MSSRYSYRGRAPARRFGAVGYRGGVGRRRVYRKRAMPIARYLAMSQQYEQKFKDLALGPTGVDTTGALLLLNGINQGTTPSTRIGSVIRMTKCELRIEAIVTVTTGIDQTHRYLLVYDRQANGAALTGANVLTTFDTTSFQLLENRDRFVVLMDTTVMLNAYADSGAQKTLRKTIRLGLPVVFIAGAGTADTIADIKTGSLYLLAVGNRTSTSAGSYSGSARLWFSDK